jgi:hypothetical protein
MRALHLLPSLLLALPALGAEPAVGTALKNVELRDATDAPASIPNFGAKVLALFYTDADVADLNDPLADAITAKHFDKSRYQGIGIVNLQDSKPPNFIIRSIVKGKIEKYKSAILTDPSHLLPQAWGLGDCNNTSVVLVVGRDGQLKYVQRGGLKPAEIEAVVKLIDALVNDAAPAPTVSPSAP